MAANKPTPAQPGGTGPSEVREHELPDGSEQPDVAVCANYLKALGDPSRLQLVRALQAGPMSVSDLAMLLEMEISNVSHHLRVLFHADLVKTQREGRFIYYHLNQDFLRTSELKRALDFGCCKVEL